MAGDWDTSDIRETEVERLQRQIKNNNEANAKKQAYLDFLMANPLFQEFLKLKSEAN